MTNKTWILKNSVEILNFKVNLIEWPVCPYVEEHKSKTVIRRQISNAHLHVQRGKYFQNPQLCPLKYFTKSSGQLQSVHKRVSKTKKIPSTLQHPCSNHQFGEVHKGCSLRCLLTECPTGGPIVFLFANVAFMFLFVLIFMHLSLTLCNSGNIYCKSWSHRQLHKWVTVSWIPISSMCQL